MLFKKIRLLKTMDQKLLLRLVDLMISFKFKYKLFNQSLIITIFYIFFLYNKYIYKTFEGNHTKTKNIENMNAFPFKMQAKMFPEMGPPMQPQATNMVSSQVLPNSTLYIGNLDSDLDEHTLYEHFSQCGQVNNIRIMRDIYSGESRGFAFVEYSNLTDANRAKLTLNHTKIQDNTITISYKKNS
jgi:RNA recognition motif-containing protein